MEKKYRKVFVTVGTTSFEYLCIYVLSRSVLAALRKIGCEVIVFQIGTSTHTPGHMEIDGIAIYLYRFKPSIHEDITNADLVISHAGAGTCLEVLAENKPLIVVVNETLMDNHQVELAERLQELGHVYACTCNTLEDTLEKVDLSLLKPFPKADPSLFIRHLDSMFRIGIEN